MNEAESFQQAQRLEGMQAEINTLRQQVTALRGERDAAREECEQRGAAILQIQGALSFRMAQKMQRAGSALGLRKVLNVLRRVKHGAPPSERPSVNAPEQNLTGEVTFDFSNMLNIAESVFCQYREQMDRQLPLSLTQVQTPCVKGLVSVILPVYNGEDMVEDSIKSVLAQTYKNFEFIILNDGSKDGTPEIIDRYAAMDARICPVHQKNQKLPQTLTNGFMMAKGEFCTWTSADNIMHPDFLEKLVGELEAHPETDMVYANIRLIDEHADPITDNLWYPDPMMPERVLLPHCVLELNTYANNYIAAAFMYRSAAAHALTAGYSTNRYTTEDYDYWMRINEMFHLRHTSFNEDIYDYRFHSGSLTAQDKELKISANRYRLMLWDNFRRGYLLKPISWIVEGAPVDQKDRDFLTALRTAGHCVVTPEEAARLSENDYTCPILISFAGGAVPESAPRQSYKICVCDTSKNVVPGWDCYVSRSKVTEQDFLEAHKGWFSFADGSAMLAYLTRKAKDAILFRMETVIENTANYHKSISVVLPYKQDLFSLRLALESLAEQSVSAESFEAIVVGQPENEKDMVSVFDTIYQQYALPEGVLRFVPSKECGFAQMCNAGLWAATGKYITYIDAESYVTSDYLSNLLSAFALYSNAAAVCGVRKEKPGEQGAYRFECITNLNQYMTSGVVAFQTSELLLFGGFDELKGPEGGSYACCGWELSALAKMLHYKRKVVETTALQAYSKAPKELCKADQADWVSNLFEIQKMGYSEFVFWPETVAHQASVYDVTAQEKLACGEKAIKEIYLRDAYQDLLPKVHEYFEMRCQGQILRTPYIVHPLTAPQTELSPSEYLLANENAHAQPIVSVIVPVYRVERYLTRCVDSLRAQTVKNIEIILVDDGSPDSCGKMCDDFATQDSRIQVIHKKNGGLSDARNAGIDVAAGEYLMFTDSDDWVEPDMVETLLYAALVCNAQIAEGSFDNVYPDRTVPETDETGAWVVGDKYLALNGMMHWKNFKCVAWNKLYHRDLFADGKRYLVGKLHEDEFFTHLAFYDATQLVFVDKTLYHYDHTRDDSITGAKFNLGGLDVVEALRERSAFFQEKNESELYRTAMDLYCWTALDRLKRCSEAQLTGDRVEQVKCWLKEDLPKFIKSGLPEEKLNAVRSL